MSQISPKTLLDQENPLAMFMYALKAPESKRQYPKRLKVFLDFLTSNNELSNSDLENQCRLIFRKLRQENTRIHTVMCLKISIPIPIENIGRQSNPKQII